MTPEEEAELDRQEQIALACDSAVAQFMQGIHQVYPDLGGEVLPDDMDFPDIFDNGVFCNIERIGESGDASVGIPSWEAWGLAFDQTNTGLSKLLVSHNTLMEIKNLMNSDEYGSCRSSDDYFRLMEKIRDMVNKS